MIPNQSARYAAAIAICIPLIGEISSTEAPVRQDSMSVVPDLLVSGTSDTNRDEISIPARNRALELTSRLPWRAPIGHRQPQQADVPQNPSISEWERQQERLNEEFDRKLIICRRC